MNWTSSLVKVFRKPEDADAIWMSGDYRPAICHVSKLSILVISLVVLTSGGFKHTFIFTPNLGVSRSNFTNYDIITITNIFQMG